MTDTAPAGVLRVMPSDGIMDITDELTTRATPESVFRIVTAVESWPDRLAHYRFVRYRSRMKNGGIVEMSANRPFGALNWPTWWLSEMLIDEDAPCVRFRHIGGVTKGMDVEWSFERIASPAAGAGEGTHIRLRHVWNGPRWPVIGAIAATSVIGPVFIHAIASRTMAGLARAAENQVEVR